MGIGVEEKENWVNRYTPSTDGVGYKSRIEKHRRGRQDNRNVNENVKRKRERRRESKIRFWEEEKKRTKRDRATRRRESKIRFWEENEKETKCD